MKKNKVSIIYSGDYDFQVLEIVNGNSDIAWEIANDKFGHPFSKDHGIVEHYDVVSFVNLTEANNWILEQVKEGRIKLH